jgi:hypothetical protein
MKVLKLLGLALGAAVAFMMAEIERVPDKPGAVGKEPTVIEGLNAADTQLIPNKNGRALIRITNGAEAIVATVVTPGTVGGLAIADQVNNIGANKIEYMGPFDPNIYNNSGGFLQLKFDKVVGVKLEIIEVDY